MEANSRQLVYIFLFRLLAFLESGPFVFTILRANSSNRRVFWPYTWRRSSQTAAYVELGISSAFARSSPQLLKDALRSPNRRLAKGYLRLLVDKVVVHPVGDREAEIEVITKGTGAVALMATSRSSVTPVLTAEGAVHAAVGDWLQLQDSNLGPGG